MSSYAGRTPDGDPAYLMGALERLEKGQDLRPLEWQEISCAIGRGQALRLESLVRRSRNRTKGIEIKSELRLPPDLARLLRQAKDGVTPMTPGRFAGRLMRRLGRRAMRRVERRVFRGTGSQVRARQRSERRRGRR